MRAVFALLLMTGIFIGLPWPLYPVPKSCAKISEDEREETVQKKRRENVKKVEKT